MIEAYLYFLICTNSINCPKEPIYASGVMYSERSCRETAPKIAQGMHYKQGGDWAWKCFKADYQPIEIK